MSSALFSSSGMREGLAELWRDGQLCDCVIVTEDGAQLPAHRVCLAAASGYFRACFIGAGTNMRGHAPGLGPHDRPHGSPGQHVVRVPEADMEDVRQVVACMYDTVIKIHPGNLERLLRLASFLEVPALLGACSDYMRQVLQPCSAVALLTLASRYGCLAVRSELVSYICGKFSSLCVQLPPPPSPDVNPATPSACHSMHSAMATQPATPSPPSRHVVGSWPLHGDTGAHGGRETLDRISAAMRRATHTAAVQSGAQAARSSCVAYAASDAGFPAGTSAPQAGISLAGQFGGHAWQGSRESDDAMQCDTGALPSIRGLMSQTRDGLESECGDERSIGGDSGGGGDGGGDVGVGGSGSCPLCGLPKDLLLEVLHSDELTVDCEMDVLQLVVDWVADDLSRLPDLLELLQAVRVEQIPVSMLGALSLAGPSHGQVVAAAQELLAGDGAVVRGGAADAGSVGSGAGRSALRSSFTSPTSHTPHLGYTAATLAQARGVLACDGDVGAGSSAAPAGVVVAAAQHATHRRVNAAFGRPRRRQPTSLVAAGGHDASWRSLKLVEVYDPTNNTWAPGPAMNHSVSFAAGAIMGRELHVVGGTPLWSCVSRLADGGSHWVPCANLPCPRAHAGVVSAAGALFVIGGRSQVQTTQQVLQSMEVLSSGCWAPGPPMATPRTALAAVALRGGLFAIGGQTAKLALKSVERYDLGSETWSCLNSGLSIERKYASAAVLGGRVYLVGGLDEVRTRLSLVEAMDPREGRWTQLAPLDMARSSAGLAALQIGAHGRLYAVGGSAPGDHVHDSVEAFVPEMGQWVAVAPLGCGRSGLALSPL